MVVCSSVYYMRVISYFGSVLVTTLQDPPPPPKVCKTPTHGICSPNILALPLGPMVHAVRVS